MNNMKPHRSKLLLLTLALAILPVGAPSLWKEVQANAQLPPRKTYQFVNGQWFDGEGFRRKTFYSVNGRLTHRKPSKVDEVIDLKNRLVVPPFGDAHTHHFDNPVNIAQHVGMYLKDGVFYAKVLTDVRTRALKVADRVNLPTSVDVSYSHGGLSATDGHPLEVYEGLALYRRPGGFDDEQIQKVRSSRLVNNDAYYIIDTASDLESKWPIILAGKPDFIKVYLLFSEEYETRKQRSDTVGDRTLDPKLIPLIVQKAHAPGLRVSAHVTSAFDYRIALKAGIDEMAHLPGHFIRVNDDPKKFQLTQEDAKETARRGVWVVPAPAFFDTFDPKSESFNAQIKERTEAVMFHNLKLLRQYKVKIAFGSDSFGRSPVKDVLYIKKLGVFTNLELIKIWCEDTPRTILPTRKLGLLSEGYEASFLVLDGDPLVDFEQIKNIRLRFKQGYLLDGPK